MTAGIMVDLHGTLLNSNWAWANALAEIDPNRSDFYVTEIFNKRNRRELVEIAGVSYDTLLDSYRKHLKPRENVLDLISSLRHYSMVLVSNGSRARVLKDLTYLPELDFERIFSKEDGRKPNKEYLEWILQQMNWDKAFLIGNDLEEDESESNRVTSIIIPYDRTEDLIIKGVD